MADIQAYFLPVGLGFSLLATLLAILVLVRRAMTPKVFISYRRSDKDGTIVANHVYAALRIKYGAAHVLLDTRSIDPGDKFPTILVEQIRASDAVVAVIGSGWDGGPGVGGTSRIMEENDWVRNEVSTGLTCKTLQVLCVSGAKLPQSLPESLKGLRDISSIPMATHGEEYEKGLGKLTGVINRKYSWWRHDWLMVALLACMLLALIPTGLGLVYYVKRSEEMSDVVHRSEFLMSRSNSQILPCSCEDFLLLIKKADEKEAASYLGQFVVWDVLAERDYDRNNPDFLYLKWMDGTFSARFEPSDVSELDGLKKETHLKIRGQISVAKPNEVLLVKCRILKK
jgi:TIR domain